jgi:hypothetical protein
MGKERPNHRGYLVPTAKNQQLGLGQIGQEVFLVKRGKPKNKAQMGTETMERVQVPPPTPRAPAPQDWSVPSPALRAETQDIPLTNRGVQQTPPSARLINESEGRPT